MTIGVIGHHFRGRTAWPEAEGELDLADPETDGFEMKIVGDEVTGVDIPVDGGWTIGDAPGVLPGEAA